MDAGARQSCTTLASSRSRGEHPRFRLRLDISGVGVKVVVMDMDHSKHNPPNYGYVMFAVGYVDNDWPLLAVGLDEYNTDESIAFSMTGGDC